MHDPNATTEARDARTTPAALQPVAVTALVLLAVYHLAGFHFALTDKGSVWLHWGTWQMFTLLDDDTSLVEAEAFYDGAWHDFDPQDLFPYEWESGPRYARSGFYQTERRMKVLAESTCLRFPRPVEKVRYTRVAWQRTLGTMDRPAKVDRKTLVDWTCGGDVRLPHGRRL